MLLRDTIQNFLIQRSIPENTEVLALRDSIYACSNRLILNEILNQLQSSIQVAGRGRSFFGGLTTHGIAPALIATLAAYSYFSFLPSKDDPYPYLRLLGVGVGVFGIGLSIYGFKVFRNVHHNMALLREPYKIIRKKTIIDLIQRRLENLPNIPAAPVGYRI